MAPPTAPTPISTLLSQALVAYTIELDNEAEHRLPHRTTNEDDREARDGSPWLVSYPLWANVLQYVGPRGSTVAELTASARTARLQLGGLRRWGYVRMTDARGEPVAKQPHGDVLVRLTRHARTGGEVWRVLPDVIEDRWRARFGDASVDELRTALRAVYDALDFAPPDYLPLVYPTQNASAESSMPPTVSARASRTGEPGLSVLLSGVLFAFTLDFEAESRISLPISANTLRVLDDEGIRLRDLPRRTGVSKEANAMCQGWLVRHGCAVAVPDPKASRGQVLRRTAKGERGQAKFARILGQTEEAWRTRYGSDAVETIRRALEPLVGDGTLPASPLAAGLEPHPDNWRARIPRPETLPHYPMVLHRGAFPDGS